jgi:hypothetical protein
MSQVMAGNVGANHNKKQSEAIIWSDLESNQDGQYSGSAFDSSPSDAIVDP